MKLLLRKREYLIAHNFVGFIFSLGATDGPDVGIFGRSGDNDWMSKKKTEIHVESRTVQSSSLPLQFTCWSNEGESQRLDNGLILSSRPKLLGGGGTVGLLLFATVLRA